MEGTVGLLGWYCTRRWKPLRDALRQSTSIYRDILRQGDLLRVTTSPEEWTSLISWLAFPLALSSITIYASKHHCRSLLLLVARCSLIVHLFSPIFVTLACNLCLVYRQAPALAAELRRHHLIRLSYKQPSQLSFVCYITNTQRSFFLSSFLFDLPHDDAFPSVSSTYKALGG
jgi:hypothetical protein